METGIRPPVFQDLPFADAVESSSADRRWLVVSVTAQSDHACKAMDDATWEEPEVRAWIEQKALAVQIDIATDRDVARGLNVRAVPTTIVLRAGRQEERIVGFHNAQETCAWLRFLEQRQAKPDGHLRDSSASMALADARYDEAMKGYVWLWNNIPGFSEAYEYGWMGVRQSFMLKALVSLVGQHPPAHEVFSALRDASGAAAPAFDLTDWFGPRVDWFLLNQILAQQDRTLEWFDRIKADPRYAAVIEHCARLLLQPLKEAHRWADVGRLFSDPLVALAELHKIVTFGSPQSEARESATSAAVTRHLLERFRGEVSVLYSGLRAAGRASDAKLVREEALRLDPSDEMRRALEQAPGSYN
jgi:hypothetical protein